MLERCSVCVASVAICFCEVVDGNPDVGATIWADDVFNVVCSSWLEAASVGVGVVCNVSIVSATVFWVINSEREKLVDSLVLTVSVDVISIICVEETGKDAIVVSTEGVVTITGIFFSLALDSSSNIDWFAIVVL